MSLVVPATACLLILGSFKAFIIAQFAQWSPEYKMWNDRISMHTRRCQQQSLWYWGLLSLFADVLEFLKFNSILKELYCVSEATLDVLKLNCDLF